MKFSYFSLHVSFAKYTENCHWHIEGVDVASNFKCLRAMLLLER